ncbi:MAG TPA: hypothetical protein VF233_09995, partial [Nitrososphaeraceae archaeon]
LERTLNCLQEKEVNGWKIILLKSRSKSNKATRFTNIISYDSKDIKLATTYRCRSCKIIIQLIEISPTKKNATHCPYCGKGVLEPRNIIFC